MPPTTAGRSPPDVHPPRTARAAIAAAEEFSVPLTVLDLDGPYWAEHFGAALVLVRPDQHVSWSGPPPADPRALIRTAVGWAG